LRPLLAISVAILATLSLTAGVGLAQAAVPQAWTSTGTMSQARYLHTATTLSDGTVLAAGGYSGGALASTELYDASSGTWSAAGNMSVPRYGHAANLLANGQVLVTGGVAGGAATASAELYDPVTGTWSPTGSMGAARYDPMTVTLADGRVLAIGGSNTQYLQSTEIYDPSTGTWSPAASLSTPRQSASATLLQDGSVLVAGGFAGNSVVSSAERYDPVANTWSPTGSMHTARGYYAAARLQDGSVLLAGGSGSGQVLNSSERYDPATGTWTSAGSMAENRSDATATPLSNGAVLVIGGTNATLTEIYDPVSDTWNSAGNTQGSPSQSATTPLADGRVLMVGGYQSAGVASAERFSLITAIDVPPIDFGDQAVGLNGTQLIPVRNIGQVPLFVTAATLQGPAAADYTIRYDHCTGVGAVGDRDTCLMSVSFQPGAAGTRDASLVLNDNTTASTSTIPLTGAGVAGTPGNDGAPGNDGTDGRDGTDGAPGTPGINGTDGAPGAAPNVSAPTPRPRRLRCTRELTRVVCTGLRAGTVARLTGVTLTRHGKVFATGQIGGGGRLDLNLTRLLLSRRYRLKIGDAGRSMVVEVVSTRPAVR
jgi:N-acetylneuraminic acid mutarotase